MAAKDFFDLLWKNPDGLWNNPDVDVTGDRTNAFDNMIGRFLTTDAGGGLQINYFDPHRNTDINYLTMALAIHDPTEYQLGLIQLGGDACSRPPYTRLRRC